VAKRCVYVPEAETPKQHLYAIDKDHQVHHFQTTYSTRFSLAKVSVSVRVASQIARPLGVRELVFIAIIHDVALFTSSVFVYTKLGPKSFFDRNCPL
jgi:hypothetical protein